MHSFVLLISAYLNNFLIFFNKNFGTICTYYIYMKRPSNPTGWSGKLLFFCTTINYGFDEAFLGLFIVEADFDHLTVQIQ